MCAAACGSSDSSGSDGADAGNNGSVTDDEQEPTVSRGETVRYQYGDGEQQFGDLTLPTATGSAAAPEPVPVVVLIHGGFWRTGYGLDLMEPLVPSLTDAGWAVWNIEYRRVGSGPEGGGGFPTTFDDAAAAIDLLDSLPDETRSLLDLDRVATVGHSAGGHLAAWLASRAQLPAASAWSSPAVPPVLAVSQAAVLDLARCISDGVGGSACQDLLLSNPDGRASATELTDRIDETSPAALIPIDATVVAVHGSADQIVPLNQSDGYVADANAAGSTSELRVIDGADHFNVIDPGHEAWAAVLDVLADQFGSG